MNVVIATGTRHATETQWGAVVRRVLVPLLSPGPAVLIHGACGLDAGKPGTGAMKGIDRIAHDLGLSLPDVQVIAIPANWTRDGFRGGPIRNGELLRLGLQYRAQGDELTCCAFHDHPALLVPGTKGGTADMERKARGAEVRLVWSRSDGTSGVLE